MNQTITIEEADIIFAAALRDPTGIVLRTNDPYRLRERLRALRVSIQRKMLHTQYEGLEITIPTIDPHTTVWVYSKEAAQRLREATRAEETHREGNDSA